MRGAKLIEFSQIQLLDWMEGNVPFLAQPDVKISVVVTLVREDASFKTLLMMNSSHIQRTRLIRYVILTDLKRSLLG